MFKALLKKQLLELNMFYFYNRKTGKTRSKAGIIGFVALFAFVFISVGFAFFGMGKLFSITFLPMKLDWLYFAIMSLISVVLGIFGDVFNTYAMLYRAKDNDLLLSMPIPPAKLLSSRLIGTYVMALLYQSLVLIPAILVYFIDKAELTVLSVIFTVLLEFVLPLFITVLTCILGFVIAFITSKVKSKTFVTVISALALIFVYYFCYFRLNAILNSVVQNAGKISKDVKTYFYPFYALGLAFCGEVLPFLAVTAAIAVLFGITCFILSKTYISIATSNRTSKKTVYRENKLKSSSVKSTLVKKEFKRFFTSPAYILNAGLGLVILLILAIVAVIKREELYDAVIMVTYFFPKAKSLIPAALAAAMCLVLSMNALTAPSISLEGKSIWILKSCPVNVKDIIYAKQIPHLVLNGAISLIDAVIVGTVLKLEIYNIILVAVYCIIFIEFTGIVGLIFNLKNPILEWTNETIPIKQSMSVLYAILIGFATTVVFAAAGYFLREYVSGEQLLIGAIVLLTLASRYLNRYLTSNCEKMFEKI